jgi:gluconate 5-dehydrogenase
MFDLNGKVALITGGSRGIGLGIAKAYQQMGAKVAITGTNIEGLNDALTQLGDTCGAYQSDITDRASHATLIEKIERDLGPLDILVNNAGRHGKMPSLECGDQEFYDILDTNLLSLFALTRSALPSMIKHGRGSVINISSMSALFGLPQVSAYSSSKTALIGLSRTLTAEYSKYGIRFNCIAPGFIESKMFRDIMKKDPERERKILDRTPMGRVGTAKEIGEAAVFLGSDASRFISGVCLPVEGGAAIGF